MKNKIFTMLCIFVVNYAQSQSVGIGTNTPNNKSILEISSTEKGLLIPRMLDSERLNIASPIPAGLMVYQTNGDPGFYYYDGFTWFMVGKGGNFWTKALNGVFNTTQNIGAGTNLPNVKLNVDGGTESTLADGTGYMMVGNKDLQNLVFDNNEIQSRNNAASAPLLIQPEGGNVGIGQDAVTASSKLQITNGVEAGSNAHGYLLLGETTLPNLVMDTDEIQARSNATTATTLNFQPMGGNTVFGDGNVGIDQIAPTSRLHINGGVDASLTSAGYMQIGTTTGPNLVFDDNEIIARNNSATSTLTLQNNGGKTLVGENLEVNGEFEGAVKFQKNSVQIPAGLGEYTLNVGNRTLIELSNQSGNLLDVTLTDGESPGQILMLLGSNVTNQMVFIDNPAYNTDLEGNIGLNINEILTLLWTGNIWVQLSFGNNH